MPHRADLYMIEFSRDARRIATASKDGTARVWDGFTGDPISPPLQHPHEVYHAVFTPDGARLATLTIGGGRAPLERGNRRTDHSTNFSSTRARSWPTEFQSGWPAVAHLHRRECSLAARIYSREILAG